MANQFVYTKIPEHLLYLVQACDPDGIPEEDCAVFRWVDAWKLSHQRASY